MLYRKHSGWITALLLALMAGAVLGLAISASAKAKTVRNRGTVEAVTANSIRLRERHLLVHRSVTYTLSASPTVHLAGGASGPVTDIPVGATVEVTGTQGPDKHVTVTEVRVLAMPKARKTK